MFSAQWPSRVCLPLVGGLALALAPVVGLAAPFEGASPLEAEANTKARAASLKAARRAAFETAVSSLGPGVDAAALSKARAAVDVWTSSYRVLEFGGEGSQVRVEVEIDVPRLRKRLTAAVPRAAASLRLGAVGLEQSCAAQLGDAVAWEESLRAAGLPLDDKANRELRVEISCTALGPVVATHLQGARVVVEIEDESGRLWRDEGFGFAVSPEQASEGARDDAVARLLPLVARSFAAPLVVRVRGVGDGSRVRRLGRSIVDGVVGADTVEIVGVQAGGAVLMGVGGALEREGLLRSLSELEFPDFRIQVEANADGESVDVEIM